MRHEHRSAPRLSTRQRFTQQRFTQRITSLLAASAFTSVLAFAPGALAARPDGKAKPSLTKLAGLHNYAFKLTASNNGQTMSVQGAVHSPTDWMISSKIGASSTTITTYDVNGHGYGTVSGLPNVQPVSLSSPQGLTELGGEYSYAKAFIGMTHVTGERIKIVGSCKVAGVRGELFDFATPSAEKKILSIADQACVASRSGALLLYTQGITGGGSATELHLKGASQVFQVTSIGHVGQIDAPHSSS